MKIKYGKNLIDLKSNVISDMCVIDLKAILQENTGVSSHNIRLINNGKILKDELCLNELPGGIYSQLVMIASNDTLTHNNDRIDSLEHIKNDLYGVRRVSNIVTKKSFVKDGYGFNDIQVRYP